MISKILVALDGSSLAENILPHAAAIAGATKAEIILLRVLEAGHDDDALPADSVSWSLTRAQAEAYLRHIQEQLTELRIPSKAVLEEGKPAELILEVAARQGADLVVIGTHGRGGPSSFPLCGTVQKVVSGATHSVLIVPTSDDADGWAHRHHASYKRVLVPVDCSSQTSWAVNLALKVVSAQASELVLGHVVPVPEFPHPTGIPLDAADLELRDRVIARNRATAETCMRSMVNALSTDTDKLRVVMRASPEISSSLEEMIDYEHADLVVLTAHGASCTGNHADRRPHGSVAARLIACVPAPLLVLQDRESRKRRTTSRRLAGDQIAPLRPPNAQEDRAPR